MPPVNRNQPVRAKSSESQYSLMEFMREFPDDAACIEWLWRNRYSEDGEHAYCTKCETERTFKRYKTSQQRQSWTCNGCGLHVHPTAGTIYHKSSTSLHLWFYAMFLMTSTRCGISAKQMERELGVNYKTAARMMRLIRRDLMADEDFTLSGVVEADETYVGGHMRKNGSRDRFKNKSVVFGMVERKGRVVSVHVSNNRAKTLIPIMKRRILPESVVYTDEAHMYKGLEKTGYAHDRIRHSESVYVSGNVHTQTIEGFWALTKNGITGVYHAVSAKHLQGYLNEYAWRYNHRDDGRAMFRTLLLRAVGS